MQKLLTLLLLLLVGYYTLNAQENQRLAAVETSLQDVQSLQLPSINNKALLETEMARRKPGRAPHFAESISVDISPSTHGNWDISDDGMAVWRLRIPSPGARSLNLGFDQFVMPEGGSLMLYTPDMKTIQGPFTPADNEEHEELWTPIIPGDEIVIEVSLPVEHQPALRLHLKTINHDFLGFAENALSGSCNLDVICSLADGWGIVDEYRDIIQSVAVISTGGGTFCTGFLVTNAREDCTPFFMTANHCGIGPGNAASLVAYWNFSNSECRQPGSLASGGDGDGALADFNTGAIHRASYSPTDFTLVEFDDPISETANAWFAGWDAREVLEEDTLICIHHPRTDEKRISFEFNGSYRGSLGSGSTPVPNGDYLIIADWDIGTTEGGSSGSPVFNSDKRVVGQLQGGAAACGNNSYDRFGWFPSSWTGGGSASSQLSTWLDPDNTGTMVMDGRHQVQCSFFVGATPTVQSLCTPEDAFYDINVNDNFIGPVTISIEGLAEGLTANFGQSTVMPGGTTSLTISGTANLGTGTYTFTLNGTDGANVSNQNLSLTLVNGTTIQPTLNSPADMATELVTQPTLAWNAIEFADTYTIEVATDADFSNIIATSSGLEIENFSTPLLDVSTTYFWRVKTHNLCGDSDWSTVFSFTTGLIACGTQAATDLPLVVGPGGGSVTTSIIEVSTSGLISSMRLLDLDISHTFIGDLSATLTSPSGTTIILFGDSNCGQENMLVNFDDNAEQSADDFANTCANASIAISGNFQPLEAFSTAFIGEEMQGDWLLKIRDNANIDGGELNQWKLDFCTLIPNIASINTSVEELTVCVGETAAFDISLGIGFNNAVTLEGTGLPDGSTIDFETNPAQAGSTLSTSIGNINEIGDYTLSLNANDGNNLVATTITVHVIDVLSAPSLVSPVDGAVDVDINTILRSAEVEAINFYAFVVSTQPDLSDPIVAFPSINTDILAGDLEYGTTYYWAVAARNECGDSELSDIWSFTTTPDISINHNITDITTCIADEVEVALILGEGFGDAPVATIESNTASNFNTFMPAFNAETGRFTLRWPNFTFQEQGTHQLTITITGEGYSNSMSFLLIIKSTPDFTTLIEPLDDDAFFGGEITDFRWDNVADAASYRIEIATDDAFSDIVYSEIVQSTNLGLDLLALDFIEQQYFWRVTAINECGESVSGFFKFIFIITSTQDINGTILDIHPNPTNGPLTISLSGDLGGFIDIDAYTSNGQKLVSWHLPAIKGTQEIDLSNLPAGVYWLNITTGQFHTTERIILLD